MAVVVSYIGFALSFLSSIAVARALGVEGKGTFSLFMAAVAGLSLFGSLGMGHGQMYHAARRSEKLRHFIPNALAVSWLVGGVVAAAYFVLGYALNLRVVALLGWTGVIAGVIAVPALSMLVFQRQLLLTVGSVIAAKVNGAARYVIPLLALGVLYAVDAVSVGNLIIAVVVGHLTLYAIYARAIRGHVPEAEGLSASFARDSFTFGIRHYLSNLAQFLTFRLDFFLVASLLGADGVGLYSVAAVLAELAAQLPREVGTILFPAFASGDLGRGRAPVVLRLTVALALLIALGCALVAEPLIILLYGSEFADAVPVFRLILPGTIAWSTIAITWTHASAHGRPGLGFWIFGVAAVVDAALVLLLVPTLGLPAAGLAATVSYLLSAVLFLRAFCRQEACSISEALILRSDDVRQAAQHVAEIPSLLREGRSSAFRVSR